MSPRQTPATPSPPPSQTRRPLCSPAWEPGPGLRTAGESDGVASRSEGPRRTPNGEPQRGAWGDSPGPPAITRAGQHAHGPSGPAHGHSFIPAPAPRCARARQVCSPSQAPRGALLRLRPPALVPVPLPAQGGIVVPPGSAPDASVPAGLLEGPTTHGELGAAAGRRSPQQAAPPEGPGPTPPASSRTASRTGSPGSCGPWLRGAWAVRTPPGSPWPCSSSRWRPGSSWRPRPCR